MLRVPHTGEDAPFVHEREDRAVAHGTICKSLPLS
jgi:hypothetical protein